MSPSPGAKLRMDTYREGQLAFTSGAKCPYTNWQAETWEKGRLAAQSNYAQSIAAEEKARANTPYPMNVYLRDENELRAFVQEYRHLLDD